MKILGFLLIVAMVVCFPLISIWSVNTLFGTAIPFNLATWFGAAWLSAIVYGAQAARNNM